MEFVTESLDQKIADDIFRVTTRTMPKQKPGRSKQDYGTPWNFLLAVKQRFAIKEFDWDLAANAENTVCNGQKFYTEEENSLVQPWKLGEGWNWLNPPFAKIEPWVQKAWGAGQSGAKTLVLVPAGVGSNWWAKWVHNKAQVLLLNGRLTFVGETLPYPKDCCLLLYAPYIEPVYEVWRWKGK